MPHGGLGSHLPRALGVALSISRAKRLRVPAYCVMHDRTLNAVAFSRPTNPRQLLEIDGIGPTKAEKFGSAIIEICGAKLITEH